MSAPTMDALFDGSDQSLLASPVDVLAVLDYTADVIDSGYPTRAQQLRVARVAVAELIDQMRDVLALWDSDQWYIDAKAAALQCRPDKWAAALARVEGAK